VERRVKSTWPSQKQQSPGVKVPGECTKDLLHPSDFEMVKVQETGFGLTHLLELFSTVAKTCGASGFSLALKNREVMAYTDSYVTSIDIILGN
jgi:hypothetical protein